MSYYKTTGIVLRRINLGEADRIVTFLTPDFGKVKAVAKGVRKIKSRLAGHLELFGEVDIMLAKGRNLDVVTSARLRHSADAIATDYNSLGHAYLFAEMLERLTDEQNMQEGLYDLARECLLELRRGNPDSLLELFFKLRMAAVMGYEPQLQGCSRCQAKDATLDYYFSPSSGGIIDKACLQEEGAPMSASQIKLWRLILSQPIVKIRSLNGTLEAAKESLPHCDKFYDHLFGRRFKSSEFLFK